ncbi:hypothetical protein RA280_15115 [Cupriavidus sp. CV2]|uniref:hypothetical protein n=1 Tax=Cupriavidus ulmosensis TaxID=3065913 RepID=UPI00296B0B19|nr:hypothetical protein [Cupriavidus sp. CV2]MDW3683054.1 hypothetical protein [Cupriavidus sp. CV2]
MSLITRKFANIATASNGQQVLFFIEPDGERFVLHQVADFEIGQIDYKVDLAVKEGHEDTLYSLVESFGVERADRALAEIQNQLGSVIEVASHD